MKTCKNQTKLLPTETKRDKKAKYKRH